MATKPGWVLTYGKVKPKMKFPESDHTITKCNVLNGKFNISSSTRPIPPHIGGW